jgi:hypothetical protein
LIDIDMIYNGSREPFPFPLSLIHLSNMTHRPHALLIFQQPQHCSHQWHLATLALLLPFFLSSSHIRCPSYFSANQNARSRTARQQLADRPLSYFSTNQKV